MRRVRQRDGWHVMVARGGRRELWARTMEPGEACVAAIDPAGRSVVWFGRCQGTNPSEDEAADACVTGAGGLWAPDGVGRQDGWEAIRRAHTVGVLARQVEVDPTFLTEISITNPELVAAATDAWLEGNETLALGAIQALVLAMAAAPNHDG